MSYKKQNFVDGQVLKAEHLNNIEEGIRQLWEEKANGKGWTSTQIALLESLFSNVTYKDESTGQNIAKSLIASLRENTSNDDSGSGEDTPTTPTVTLTSIQATYNGGDVSVGTELTDLASDIVVTAKYSDGTSQNVNGYELSGSIVEGVNTIIVTYGGKTTTFTVNGIAKPIDTSPQIAEYDKGFYWGSQIETSSYTGACVTIPYTFEHDIDSLKANTNYDAENDYMIGTTMYPTVTYYVTNTKFLENGNSVVSTKTKVALYRDDSIVEIATLTPNATKNTCCGGKNSTDKMYCNGIAFTLFTDDVEDSYAYWTITGSQIAPIGVRNGDIIFAGKNTQYYGMKNIDELQA